MEIGSSTKLGLLTKERSKMSKATKEVRAFALQIEPVKTTAEEIRAALEAAGIAVISVHDTGIIHLREPDTLEKPPK